MLMLRRLKRLRVPALYTLLLIYGYFVMTRKLNKTWPGKVNMQHQGNISVMMKFYEPDIDLRNRSFSPVTKIPHWNKTSMNVIINELRLNQVKFACQAMPGINISIVHSNETEPLIPDSFVMEKFKVIFQANAKTGRTAWQLILWNNTLSGIDASKWKRKSLVDKTWEITFLEKYGIRTMRTYKPPEVEHRMKSYDKILTVRHPLVRLESVYLDKISSKSFYFNLYGKDILKRYRKKTKNNAHAFATGQGVTFEEFLRFVIDNPTIDGHWQGFIDSSHPCIIKYSYIAKTETADDDMDYVIRRYLAARGGHVTKNKRVDHKISPSLHGSSIKLKLFSDLKNPKYYVDKLEKLYAVDMDMFGYTYRVENHTVYAMCKQYISNKCV